jgi:uncharacterized protein
MNKEIRSYRAEYQTDGNTLSGFGAIFNSPTTIREGGRTFTEIVRPEAFARSLKANPDILVCFNHDANRLLGRTSAGTAKVWADNTGLRFSVELPEHARDVKEMFQRGDLQGCSFMFSVKRDKWDGNVRELLDLDVYECGPVVMPAYQDAVLTGLRSKEVLRKRLKLMEWTV